MRILILFVAAFLPSVIYMILIRNTEKYEREPWRTVVKVFIWGAVFGVILAIIFSTILIILYNIAAPTRAYQITGEDYTSTFILAVIIAPFAEEFAKGLGVFSAGDELDEVEDGLIYGAACGLGFAATENIFYGAAAWAEGGFWVFFGTIIVRSIASVLLHASATAATGYGISRKRMYGGGFILPYYLLAVGMHALFNFFAIMETLFGLILAIMFAMVAIEFTRRKIHQLDDLGASEGIRHQQL
jgi:RsiW-degrading membrane proteinase PrsW (M82 family)